MALHRHIVRAVKSKIVRRAFSGTALGAALAVNRRRTRSPRKLHIDPLNRVGMGAMRRPRRTRSGRQN